MAPSAFAHRNGFAERTREWVSTVRSGSIATGYNGMDIVLRIARRWDVHRPG